ncbi:MAG: DUF192 domain-containing protein [Candidatus Woesearchaeota archaeon]
MIQNATTQEVLAEQTILVKSFFGQAHGLMFRKPLTNQGWVFLLKRASKWHLTNLFVFFAIDALWLDKDKNVLQKKTLQPFQLHAAGIANTRYVIELHAGSAKNVRVGDRISWDKKVL